MRLARASLEGCPGAACQPRAGAGTHWVAKSALRANHRGVGDAALAWCACPC